MKIAVRRNNNTLLIDSQITLDKLRNFIFFKSIATSDRVDIHRMEGLEELHENGGA